jgi:uncharacterized protein (DUF433 family)
MTLAPGAEPLPLKANRDGVLRVGGTRVTLDTVVAAFNAGAAPEEIVLRYDSLRLEDVYLVVGYYLRHRAEVDAHLAERRRRGEARRAEAEARLSWSDVRERLLARRRGSADTASGDG